MSLLTTIYHFIKPGLTDSPPDITVMNPNWDAIDAELNSHEAQINNLVEYCTIYHSVNQSAAQGAITTLTFDSERFDDYGMHDSINPKRITPKKEGYYVFIASVAFASNTANVREVEIMKNGTQYIAINNKQAIDGPLDFTITTPVIYMNGTTDYVEVSAFQNSGVALNIEYKDAYSPIFSAYKVG